MNLYIYLYVYRKLSTNESIPNVSPKIFLLLKWLLNCLYRDLRFQNIYLTAQRNGELIQESLIHYQCVQYNNRSINLHTCSYYYYFLKLFLFDKKKNKKHK